MLEDDDNGLIRRGVCNIPADSSLIEDADEEVFLLYTDLAGKSTGASSNVASFRGLGHVDSHQDILTVTFELTSSEKIPSPIPSKQSKKGRTIRQKKQKTVETETIEVHIAQDKTALRSRKGDTGSVVWKASIDFAQHILQQHHSHTFNSLFDYAKLEDAHVLELGAGTGLLGVVLGRLVRQYTATDIDPLIPLIRKNLSLNIPGWVDPSQQQVGPCTRSVTAEPLDWVVLHQHAPSRKPIYSFEPVDLLLVVDCIYHPSLLPSLVHTIDYLTTPGRTAVLVLVELRAEDVIREFLERWLKISSEGSWEIWHVNGGVEGPYAMWLGWKSEVIPSNEER
ncbi:hypothetical protein ABKN59_005937 [Abortiporus biennis]